MLRPRSVLGLAIALLAGCSSSHTPLEERVAAATLEAWDAAGMPEPARVCRPEALRIEHPATLLAFQRACAAPGMDPRRLEAWACMQVRLEDHRARSLEYPAAVLRPDLAEESWPSAAVHELAHYLVSCSVGPMRDPFDALHADGRVWKGTRCDYRPDSVEARAIAILSGEPAASVRCAEASIVPAWPPE